MKQKLMFHVKCQQIIDKLDQNSTLIPSPHKHLKTQTQA